jgi:hypothetical protein
MEPKHVLGYIVCAIGGLTAFCSLPVFGLSAQRFSNGYAIISDSCKNGALMGGAGFVLLALGIVSIGIAMLSQTFPGRAQNIPFGLIGFVSILVGIVPAFVGLNRGLECVWGS